METHYFPFLEVFYNLSWCFSNLFICFLAVVNKFYTCTHSRISFFQMTTSTVAVVISYSEYLFCS